MTGLVCEPSFPSSPLPGRTAAIVDRERHTFSAAVQRLVERNQLTFVDPEEQDGEAPPVVLRDDRLVEVLHGAVDNDRLAAWAAFVAGRCTTGHDDADAVIHDALRGALATVDQTQPLGSAASLFVEAVMSLALLGEVDQAVSLFTAQLSHPTNRSMEDSLMAGYLAQLGSPAGYTLIQRELRDPDSDQLRRNAVDQMRAFLPYDGESVDGVIIDIEQTLRDTAKESSEYVAERVRDVLRELGLTRG